MRLGPDSDVHLTYCTNIHAGETWPQVRSNLERYVVAVKKQIAPTSPFGVGLRLSAAAAAELTTPAALAELRALLVEHDLYVFTINGFPYGNFHGTRVKESVYRPDWSEPARLAYTNALADLLAALVPSDVEGSISTAPLGFAPRMREAAAEAAAVQALLEHAAHLHKLRERTGVTIGLAIEPEPACRVETTADALELFQKSLFDRSAIAQHARAVGGSLGDSEESLRRHLGLCLDTCHAAVEFENPRESVARIRAAALRVLKVQLTAGLRAEPASDAALAALGPFADDVYLHQVVARTGQALERHVDLPDALTAARSAKRRGEEWRVHFHVPLHFEAEAPLGGTHDFVRELLALQRESAVSRHLEVETYTWDVLPARYRHDDVVAGIVGELRWAMERLAT